MSKTQEQVAKELNGNIPSSEISYRDAGNGKELAYFEGWVSIDLMNEIVGIGNWAYHVISAHSVFEGKDAKERYTTSYLAHVQLTAQIGGKEVQFSDYGYGDGSDKTSQGKAHELAVKEAVTDGVKRCIKSLGRRVGLALYDKKQEFVTNSDTAKHKAKTEAKTTKSTIDSITNVRGSTANESSGTPSNTAVNDSKYQKSTEKEIKDLISATSRVVIKKGKATKEALVDTLKKDFSTDSKEHLNLEQARKFLLTLESMAQ